MSNIGFSFLRRALVPVLLVPCAALSVGCQAGADLEEEEVASVAQPVYHTPITVGVRCQQDYQSNWASDVGNSDVWWRCGNFINQIQSTDTVGYYYNLVGAKPMWESTYSGLGWSYGGLDSVDLFYTNEHGGINSQTAAFAMWDQNTMALTQSMRLGQQNVGLSVLATFACDTLSNGDGLALNRWLGVFAGGLRIVVGAHGSLYAGNTGSSTNFAVRMQNGEPIGASWLESAWYSDNNNHPAVMNVGANSTDCWNRMGATIGSVKGLPRLRDGQIGYMCWSTWN